MRACTRRHIACRLHVDNTKGKRELFKVRDTYTLDTNAHMQRG